MTNIIQQGATDLSVACAPQEKAQKAFYPAGYIKNKCYFYVPARQEVVAISLSRFKAPWTLTLAPISWWQSNYPTTDSRCTSGVKWTEISPQLIEECFLEGEYKGLPTFLEKKLGVKL